MHVKTSLLLFFLLTHTFITNQDCFGKTDDKSSKNSSSICPVCLDVDMDNFCANMCVCVRYGWYQKPGRVFEKGNMGIRIWEGFCRCHTTQSLVHQIMMFTYLLQHNQASTTPHTPPAYVLNLLMTIDHSLESLYVATPPPIHPQQSDVPDAPTCVTCDSTRLMSV